jgi:hypothetical protein
MEKQAARTREKLGCREVEFDVVIKDGKTLLKWTSNFEAPSGADGASATRAVETLYDSGLAKLVNNFARQ